MAFEARSITGSLFGTASYSPTASWGIGSFEAYRGTASLQGDLDVNNNPIVSTNLLIAQPNNNYAFPSAGSDLTFTNYEIIGSNSDISFSGTTFTLKGGKQYEIELVLGLSTWSSVAFGEGIVTVENAGIGNLNLISFPNTFNRLSIYPIKPGAFNYNNRLYTRAAPTIDSTGKITVTSLTGTVNILADNSYLIIRKISK